jgi:nucleotide-binding universal stress UspA family protein
MYKHLLVPLDGTPLATTTVEQATSYAASTGARITFLHARADIGASADGALLYTMSPQDFNTVALGNAGVIVAKAEAAARAAGVPCTSKVVTCDHTHEAILDAASNAGCDLIYMASHGRRGLQGALLGSVTRKVLQHTTLPVLVSAIESNQAVRTDEQRALGILRNEHRSLAAVVHALVGVVDDTARSADPALLRAMLFYIEQFPQRLHQPKEEDYLFSLLRKRTSECDTLLLELQHQHQSGADGFADLRRDLDSDNKEAFRQSVHAFAKLQSQHMDAEEKLVLPAASRHLLAHDWSEIAKAFGTNADPSFATNESFDDLASSLIALAQGNPASDGAAT